MRHHGPHRFGGRAVAAFAAVCAFAISGAALAPEADAATLPPGFQETTVLSGLSQPIVVRFSPDGRVLVAEKSGLIKIFPNLGTSSSTVLADLRTNTYNFWDRGLLGMALDPNFPASPYVYVLYAYDHILGDSAPAPRWGTPGVSSDPCPTPPGATSDGCVVSARLSRLVISGNVATAENVLIEDWCQQYPSHSVGALEFGADGALYATGGDGASFNWVDYGQAGNPKNPCGDPPVPVGGTQTAPSAEGGALRSQDLRTSGDPVTLDGTVIRIDPATGAAMPDNPLAFSSDLNARRVIGYGLRNPFRFTIRPGTNEIWAGDVGWNIWEEINRIASPVGGSVVNFGWPCYEGTGRQSGYDGADLSICENLYASPGAVTAPYYAYNHSSRVVTGESCPTGSSSIAGLSFAGDAYGSDFGGALFFADYSRDCIWVMKKGTDGLPSTSRIETFVAGAMNPVMLERGPGGKLFYVDLDGGTIRRIDLAGPPPACPRNQFAAEYFANQTLTAPSAVTGCESSIDYDWGSGGPAGVANDSFSARWTGTFDFSAGDQTFTAASDDGMRVWVDGTILIDRWASSPGSTSATRRLEAGPHEVKVEYFEATGNALARLTWSASTNSSPSPSIASPSAGTTWRVGDAIPFSGSASDPEDGTIPPSGLSWDVILHHCPSNCHTHPVQSFSGSSGTFSAPDHEYPSHVELRLTATDAQGATGTTSVLLDPQTVGLTFASNPQGLDLVVNGAAGSAPFTRTVIVGSTNSLSAPSPQTSGGQTYEFDFWSDGGARTHDVTAGSAAQTFTATFRGVPSAPQNTSPPTISGAVKVRSTLTASEGAWSGAQPITYAFRWQDCGKSGNGSKCADIAGATGRSYVVKDSDAGTKLRVVVTATNASGSATAASALTSPVAKK